MRNLILCSKGPRSWQGGDGGRRVFEEPSRINKVRTELASNAEMAAFRSVFSVPCERFIRNFRSELCWAAEQPDAANPDKRRDTIRGCAT